MAYQGQGALILFCSTLLQDQVPTFPRSVLSPLQILAEKSSSLKHIETPRLCKRLWKSKVYSEVTAHRPSGGNNVQMELLCWLVDFWMESGCQQLVLYCPEPMKSLRRRILEEGEEAKGLIHHSLLGRSISSPLNSNSYPNCPTPVLMLKHLLSKLSLSQVLLVVAETVKGIHRTISTPVLWGSQWFFVSWGSSVELMHVMCAVRHSKL